MAAMEFMCSSRSPSVQEGGTSALKPYSTQRQQRKPVANSDSLHCSPAAIRARVFLEMAKVSSKCPEVAAPEELEEMPMHGLDLNCEGTGSESVECHQQRKRQRRLSAVSSDDLDFCSQTLDAMPAQTPLSALCLNTMPPCETSNVMHVKSINTSASLSHEKLQDKQTKEADIPKPPPLSATEWLQDEHFTYVIENWMEPPSHCWIATPAQVVLMRSGQDQRDRCVGRDGNLRSLWDSSGVSTLLLPFNSDKHAGRRSGAGSHWSLLVVRRTEGYEVKAQLFDSLAASPPAATKTASELLRYLTNSQHWQGVPRRPELHALGLQHDNYQCGIFCLLAIRHQLKIEAGETLAERKITAAMASRLRQRLCESSKENAF